MTSKAPPVHKGIEFVLFFGPDRGKVVEATLYLTGWTVRPAIDIPYGDRARLDALVDAFVAECKAEPAPVQTMTVTEVPPIEHTVQAFAQRIEQQVRAQVAREVTQYVYSQLDDALHWIAADVMIKVFGATKQDTPLDTVTLREYRHMATEFDKRTRTAAEIADWFEDIDSYNAAWHAPERGRLLAALAGQSRRFVTNYEAAIAKEIRSNWGGGRSPEPKHVPCAVCERVRTAYGIESDADAFETAERLHVAVGTVVAQREKAYAERDALKREQSPMLQAISEAFLDEPKP